jgi:hypothetical protein
MILFTTRTITVNYIQESHKTLDLHKPADFTHTNFTIQEMAVNPPRRAYASNFVIPCSGCDRNIVVQLLNFALVRPGLIQCLLRGSPLTQTNKRLASLLCSLGTA